MCWKVVIRFLSSVWSDRCARCTLTRFLVQHLRTCYLQLRSHLVICSTGGHFHLCHRAYTRQRLTAETHRTQVKQVLRIADLRGRMTFKRQTCVRHRHSRTVVRHLDKRLACIANKHTDTASTRIKRVLNQLFQTRCRALNNLTRSNLIGNTIR